MVLDECMYGLPEDGGAADAGNLARKTERAGDFRRGDFNAQGALRLNGREFSQRIARTVGDELAVINVGDVAAALGVVHEGRSDEKRDAMSGRYDEVIRDLAARHAED